MEYGQQSLASFSKVTNALPVYKAERTMRITGSGISSKLASGFEKVIGMFSHENILVCFFAWYAVMAFLIFLAWKATFYLAPEMKIDSVILATLIGTPLASAAVMAVALSGRHSKLRKRGE